MSAEVENVVLELFDLREDDESSNAEAARGRLDGIWHAASVADRELLAGLLADLKMLRASEVPLDALKHRDAAELEGAALTDARRGRWPAALSALRGPRSVFFSEARAAAFRAVAWSSLGFAQAGARFRQFAEHRDPSAALEIAARLAADPSPKVVALPPTAGGLIPHQARYYALELTRRFAADDSERLAKSLADAQVDLNPHQIEAALFAFRSPFAKGALLADEVGLGKTIEAALVLAQRWAERKRKLIVICPASLRKQWAQELNDKFNLPAKIMETRSFNDARKTGRPNPLDLPISDPAVVVCSYQFAAKQADALVAVPWHLAVIDEAHRLRNVYKSGNRTAKALKTSLANIPKLLLTATPLQNSVMELYGLTSFIDEHLFGDEKGFRAQYGRLDNDAAYADLRARLDPVCTRTLRRQVRQYVPYTSRIPLTQEFVPTAAEQSLYDNVSDYLRRESLNALPSAQRQLMVLVMRKLLASSTFAIAGALETLIRRLESSMRDSARRQERLVAELEQDFEQLSETAEEWDGEDEDEGDQPQLTPEQVASIEAEVRDLKAFRDLAVSITENAKGHALLSALQAAFSKARELGAAEKAIIFTESRRTQDYLFALLNRSGYEQQQLLFNGTNADPHSRAVYARWVETHRGTDRVSGSRSADMRAALVDHFRDGAKIMIATEAAAEGINLQFCSLVVNYDLPWNPQRVEQRIGRCHRYGQKYDVVVVNFLNKNNAADQRVYELLAEKFLLFSGVFGASDEILGVIESGVDFERRVVEIYQRCRTPAEIEAEFARLRSQLEEQIRTTMLDTRRKLLENFDADVTDRLRLSLAASRSHLTKIETMLWNVTRYALAGNAEFAADQHRFELSSVPPLCPDVTLGTYDMSRGPQGDQVSRYRPGHLLAQYVIARAATLPTPDAEVVFDYTGWGQKSEAVRPLVGRAGKLLVQQVTVRGAEAEDHIVLAGIFDDGTELEDDQVRRLVALPVARIEAGAPPVPDALQVRAQHLVADILTRVGERQAVWLDEEMSKLERWAEDKRAGLKARLRDVDDEIKSERKRYREAGNLPDKLALQRRIAQMESARDGAWREYDAAARDVEKSKERLIDDVEARLQQKTEVERIFALRWSVA